MDKEVKCGLSPGKIEAGKNIFLEVLKLGNVRGDYKGQLQLPLLFIREDVPNCTHLRSSGAMMHTRLMSKDRYLLLQNIFVSRAVRNDSIRIERHSKHFNFS